MSKVYSYDYKILVFFYIIKVFYFIFSWYALCYYVIYVLDICVIGLPYFTCFSFCL